jgi:hypothetical protein
MAPLSNSADRFSMEFGFTGGAAWRFTSDLSLTADRLWSALGVQEDSAMNGASRPADVTPHIQFGTVNIKFLCPPGPIPVSSFNATRRATKPGLKVGVGLTAGRFFAEIRYHFMWGPAFDTPAGSEDANGQFFPLTVGVTF